MRHASNGNSRNKSAGGSANALPSHNGPQIICLGPNITEQPAAPFLRGHGGLLFFGAAAAALLRDLDPVWHARALGGVCH